MEHETMEAQGKRLKELRKRLDLKQRDVAERLEMDTGTVGKWEAAMQRIPKTRLYQICNEYNVSRDWLERGEGEMFVEVKIDADALRKQIVALYTTLDEPHKTLAYQVAKGIIEANGNTKAAIESADAAVKTFVNNGVNNGTQRID